MFALFQLLCESAPLATLVMMVVLIMVRRGRASATRMHLMMTAACLLSIAAPLLVIALPKWRVIPALPMITASEKQDNEPPKFNATLGQVDKAASSYPLWFEIASAIWLSGAFALLAGSMWQQRCLRQMLEKTKPARKETLAMASRLKNHRRIRQNIRVVVRTDSGSAFTCGVFKPYIVLPHNYEVLPFADLRIILDHEMAHIQRLDSLHGWVLQVFMATWWFHPLAWVTFRHVNVMKEQACDDLVLLSGEDPRRYAACLGGEVLRSHRDLAPKAIVSTFARRITQLDRLKAILDPSRARTQLTSVETLRIYAPMTLAVVMISSLGFKAASEAQPHKLAVLKVDADTYVPCIWSDALVPIARNVGFLPGNPTVKSDGPSLSQSSKIKAIHQPQHPSVRTKDLTHSVIGSRDSSNPAPPTPAPQETDTTEEVAVNDSSELEQFPVRNRASMVSSRSFGNGPDLLPGGVSSQTQDQLAGLGSFSGSGTSSVTSSTGSSGSKSGLVIETDDNSSNSAYGYVTAEDGGINVYSAIGSTLQASSSELGSIESSFASSASANEADPGIAGSEILAESSASVTSQVVDAFPGVSTESDLGIRSMQASISQSDNGGHLAVECEVPEQTAAFWSAEASKDSLSWTSSESVISHEITEGSTPGYIRVSAFIKEPVSTAPHQLLRLRGKW